MNESNRLITSNRLFTFKSKQASHRSKMTNPAHPLSTGAAKPTMTLSGNKVSSQCDKHVPVADVARVGKESSAAATTNSTCRSWDGLGSGLLAIGIYALMHDSGILTIVLLAIVWRYSLEESHQRIFLFFLVLLNFAEYFYLLPPVLARYQQEDWWDVPTIKTALLTMFIFWSIAWFSAYYGHALQESVLVVQQSMSSSD
jgi:hypothetical protein